MLGRFGWIAALLAALVASAATAQTAGDDEGAALFESQCAACHVGTDFAPGAAELADDDLERFRRALEAHPEVGVPLSFSQEEAAAIHEALQER